MTTRRETNIITGGMLVAILAATAIMFQGSDEAILAGLVLIVEAMVAIWIGLARARRHTARPEATFETGGPPPRDASSPGVSERSQPSSSVQQSTRSAASEERLR